MQDEEFRANLGIDRRTLIKRGAVVGGTLVWAAPVVQSLSAPAFAAGSPLRECQVETCTSDGTTREIRLYDADPACCDCLNGVAGACAGDPCADKTQVGPTVTEPGSCTQRT